MTRSPFDVFLDRHGFVVLDGGLATALEAAGQVLHTSLWSAGLILDAPEALADAHMAYLEAGADCISTAGYQASFEGFLAAGLTAVEAEEAIRRAVAVAVEVRDAFWDRHRGQDRLRPLVAASAGPYGALLADGSEYDGRYGVTADVLERFHGARLDLLADTAADVVAFETVPSALEAEVIVRLLSDRPRVAAWLTFSCRDGEALWDGTSIEEATRVASAVPLAGVGVNCTAPRHVRRLIEKMTASTDLPVIAYPNSGEHYDPTTRRWTGEPAAWLDLVAEWVGAGAHILGGCCRVGAPTIRALRTRLQEAHAL